MAKADRLKGNRPFPRRNRASLAGARFGSLLLVLLCASSTSAQVRPSPQVRISPDNGDRVELFDGQKWVALGTIDKATNRFVGGETPELHGADGHCSPGTNDTVAVQAFLDAVRDGGSGTMSGCYLVDEGKLVLSPSSTAKLLTTGAFKTYAAPQITGSATITGRGTAHGALLSVSNPSQDSGNGSFYGGGALPNLVFSEPKGRPDPTNDGLVLQGLFNWRIGQIAGQSLGGSALALSRRTVNGNPDAYGSGGNTIAAVLCTNCGRPALDIGALTDSGQTVAFVAAYGQGVKGAAGETGALVSGGQGTQILHMAAAFTHGWAVTYGQPGQHGNRQSAHEMELHAPEKGLWVGAMLNADISGRINFAQAQGGNVIWPLVPLKLGGQGTVVRGVTISLIYRLDKPTTLADLLRAGFVDLSNDPNLDDVTVRITVVDNAGTGLFQQGRLMVPVTQLIRNRSRTAGVTIFINGNRVVYPGMAG